LQGAKAQRCRRAEKRRENGKDVDKFADRTFNYADAKQGGKRGGDQLFAAQAVGSVGHGDAHYRVHGPGVQRPVED
jgi:hypothetical protein